MRNFVWLFLSSFGIMFAILSWLQESKIIPNDIGSLKGFLAVLFGALLYFFFAEPVAEMYLHWLRKNDGCMKGGIISLQDVNSI